MAEPMIDSLDHVTIGSVAPAQTRDAYEMLLGRAHDAEGRCQTSNIAVVVEAVEAGQDPGLRSAAFGARDFAAATRLIERRGVSLVLDADGAAATADVHGLTLMIVDRPTPRSVPSDDDQAAILGLDHIVIRTTNPDRAVALFGARLGLDLRLDRAFPERSARQLFFRCGDLVVELVTDLRAVDGAKDDEFGGLAWRARDAAAAHARLTAAGMSVSELRTGRKKGTRVFTVRDKALGVPTLVIGP